MPAPPTPPKPSGSNWWTKLDPKRKRLVMVVGIAVAAALIYLLTRRGAPEATPSEQQEDATRSGLEETYPTAFQYGYPGGPGMEGGGSGFMEPGSTGEPGIEGPEGQPGIEGPEGQAGPTGAPGPHKNAMKRQAGKGKHGGGHGTGPKGTNKSGGTSAAAAHKTTAHQKKKQQAKKQQAKKKQQQQQKQQQQKKHATKHH